MLNSYLLSSINKIVNNNWFYLSDFISQSGPTAGLGPYSTEHFTLSIFPNYPFTSSTKSFKWEERVKKLVDGDLNLIKILNRIPRNYELFPCLMLLMASNSLFQQNWKRNGTSFLFTLLSTFFLFFGELWSGNLFHEIRAWC